MKKVLAVDCCISGSKSRTKKIFDAFLSALPEEYEIEYLKLEEENLSPLVGPYYEARQKLLAEGRLDHPRFRYAHQFAAADIVVIAAPFWDLSFPALLKIYIEQLCVDGITFKSAHGGLKGICRAKDLVYITSRGGVFDDSPLEMGSRYLEAMSEFFGIENYHLISADGTDMSSIDTDALIEEKSKEASVLASGL